MVTTLETQKRDKKENLEKMRQNGMMPAVYYGKKVESTTVSVSLKEFKKVFKEVGGSEVFKLKIEKDALDVLINDVDIHPVTEEPRHADFYVIEKGQKIKVNVPFVFVGESPAIKNMGGSLVKVLHELEIEASPVDVPHEIEIDISAIIDFETNILVKDLKLAQGIKIINDLEETIIMASEPKEEEEIAPEVDMDSIEVEKKGKEDKDQSARPASSDETGGENKEDSK